jgi:LmbE family N-acetylglucosaminyl deacetylase
VVILPYWDARHPDHSHACQIGYEGCYLAGLAKLDLPAGAGKPHRPHKIIYSTMYDADFRIAPSFVVDISPYFKQRMRAVACYRSQFRGPQRQRGIFIPLTGIEQRMATYCGYFGQLIGVAYGEPFVLREALQVDDIVALQGLPL